MAKICFTYPTMFHPERGGVERVTDQLTKEFVRRGHQVFYLVNKYDEKLSGFDYSAEHSYFPDLGYNSPRNHDFYKSFLKENCIDFVINQCGAFSDSTLYCDTAGTNTKTISCIHTAPIGLYPYLFNSISHLRDSSAIEKIKRIARIAIYPRLKKQYYKSLISHYSFIEHSSDCVSILSESYREELAMLNPRIKPVVIHNPAQNLESTIKDNSGKENLIIWVGRMDSRQKRPDRMVEIWRKVYKALPDWRLVMIGDGEKLKETEYNARDLRHISFTGYCDPTLWYRKARIICMTSTFEGYPMVLIEALSHGVVPIVFNSFSALNDLVFSDNQKVKPFSTTDFAHQLLAVSKDENLMDSLRIEGYRKAASHNICDVADSWEDLFKTQIR